ncbi:MAG: acyl-CoA dehydrogenase family protein [Deltaproteobacteria bacterium]|nr:acyl-CoA dehydrogenase family protein [Deltaproteobacteria bacterium]
MDFEFNEEEKALADMVRKFAQKELAPNYAKWDREEKFPHELNKKMGELGLIGATVSSEKGGMGASHVSEGIITEETSRGDCSLTMSTFVVGHLIASILEQGSETIREKFLAPFLAGDSLPAFCLTEPGCGTDAAAMRTSAVKKGSSYILNGEKSGITAMMDADIALIFAKTDPEAGARGVSCFVVPTDYPGVTCQSYADMGCRAIVRGSIFMEDVEIPDDFLVGEEGNGFIMGMQGFDISRILLALEAIAPAMVSLEETIAYTKERNAFGRPLATFEGVSFPIVEHVSILEAVRLLCYKGLWLRDNGKSTSQIAGMIKWMAPRFSTNAIRDCLVLHGHYGYTQEFPFEQRLRDVMAVEIADGTSQVSKLVAMREIFGREYLPYNYRNK